MNKSRTRYIVYLSVLTALVAVLQAVLGNIRIGPTSFSVVLIPIVLGGMLLGVWAGAFLGFVFGLIVLIFGITGADAFTSILFNEQPVVTTLICLVKGILAGVVPALIYKAFPKDKKLWGAIVASLVAPIINTGVFILGCLCITGTIEANFVGGTGYDSAFAWLVLGVAGVNFLVEFAVSAVLSPAIERVVRIVEKRFSFGSIEQSKTKEQPQQNEQLENNEQQDTKEQ